MEDPERRQIDSWQAAEHNARDWMRAWRYRDAQVTATGADLGIDVQASKAIAQVKWEASQVGRPALQRLFGARGRAVDKELLFFTGAGYSAQAEQYAAEMDIALFKYLLDGRMNAVNEHANAVVSRALDIKAEEDAAAREAEEEMAARKAAASEAAAIKAKKKAAARTADKNEETSDGCAGVGALIFALILFAIASGVGWLASVSWVPEWLMAVPGLIGLLLAAVGVSLIRSGRRQRKDDLPTEHR